ncbi:MAG: hypothetical protein HGB01_06985 [Chlorobiaceae bacterium]|nr:hypothetical protein [Chlorobiaceae bacterium]
MKVIKPVPITEAVLVSSNVPESEPLIWNASTSYVLGDRVMRPTLHKIYVCLVAGVDATPPESSALLSTPHWAEYGPTNRWAMFDNQASTETVKSSPIEVAIKPGIVNALALINVYGTKVKVEMTYGGETVFSESRNLDMSELTDWYDYFFAGFDLITQTVFTGLPPFAGGEITVTIESVGTVSCGALIVGSAYEIGDIKYEPTVEIQDYSVKQTDEFGTTTFVQRKYAKKLECALWLENNRLNSVFGLIASLRAIPSVWIGSEDIRMGILTVFGWYAVCSITIPYPDHSLCTLQIQGLT